MQTRKTNKSNKKYINEKIHENMNRKTCNANKENKQINK